MENIEKVWPAECSDFKSSSQVYWMREGQLIKLQLQHFYFIQHLYVTL